MFRTTTTYLQYHNNISSVPQQHIFSTTTTYLQYHKNISSVPQGPMFRPNTSSLLPRKGPTLTSDRLPLLRLLLPLLPQPHVQFAAIHCGAPYLQRLGSLHLQTSLWGIAPYRVRHSRHLRSQRCRLAVFPTQQGCHAKPPVDANDIAQS